MTTTRSIALIAASAALFVSLSLQAGVPELQEAWARAMYQTGDDERETVMATLSEQARGELADHPEDPALLIWNGIILSSYAGERGGLGALGLVKEARTALERALERDPEALQGSAYTSLGSLYYKVPGWPLGFGSSKQARRHLQRALEINPTGIDPNYFMGEFLFEEGDYDGARAHLTTALQAPDRPGRALADAGRREEIRDLLAEIDRKLH